jgi:AMIN domain
MNYLPKIAWISFLAAAFVYSPVSPVSAQTAQIRHLAVHNSGGSLQIEIETSKRVVPLTQVITDPDRLVIDFADSVAGPELRNLAVNSGQVKGIRVGRVTANPPITRVVVDLKSAQPFQLFPSNKSIVVKLGEGNNAVAQAPKAPQPAVERPAAAAQPAAEPVSGPTTIQLASIAPAPKQAKPALRVASARAAPPTPTPAVSVSREPVGVGPNAQVRHVAVLKSGGATEIEIATSQRVSPEVQAITGPDRLVVDFPQSTPGPQLRALAVNQGAVKGVRVALLSSKPPVTRVVLDLASAQAYQVFPSAKSVIVKLPDSMGVGAGSLSSPQIVAVPETAQAPPPAPKKVEVSFEAGRLRLNSVKASLAEVLNEVSAKTGAEIVVPPGADLENVIIALGPGTPREVLSQLLNGSAYNFIIVGKDEDANQIERVILSSKTPGGVTYEQSAIPPVPMEAQQRGIEPAPAPLPPAPQAEDVQPQGDSNPPPDTTPQPGDPQAAPN